MWLSPNGLIRMDQIGPDKFRVSKWVETRNDWVFWFESPLNQKLRNFSRIMKFTRYPEVPDYAPTE